MEEIDIKKIDIEKILDMFEDDYVIPASKMERPQSALDREMFEDFNKRNPQAIFDRIKSQTKAEVTAQMLKMNPVQRARGINRQPTPESLARQQWDTMLTNPQMTQGS